MISPRKHLISGMRKTTINKPNIRTITNAGSNNK
jgi:hypothetical protein